MKIVANADRRELFGEDGHVSVGIGESVGAPVGRGGDRSGRTCRVRPRCSRRGTRSTHRSAWRCPLHLMIACHGLGENRIGEGSVDELLRASTRIALEHLQVPRHRGHRDLGERFLIRVTHGSRTSASSLLEASVCAKARYVLASAEQRMVFGGWRRHRSVGGGHVALSSVIARLFGMQTANHGETHRRLLGG